MEQQIAMDLADKLRKNPDPESEFRFHDDQSVYIIRWICRPISSELDKGTYLSAGSAGDPCPCCNGSGIRSDDGSGVVRISP